MAKTWDDFLPLITPQLSGCPDLTIKTYLAITAADFFTRTHLWREDIDPIYVAPGLYEYDLDGEALIEDLISVTVERRELQHTDMRLIPNDRRYDTGFPTHYWIHSDNQIRLHPIPDQRLTVKMAAVLRPSRTGTGVPDWIYEMWADIIVAGTVDKLASMPNKTWTDPNLAQHSRMHYEQGITSARVRDMRGVGHSVRMRPFA